MSKIDQNTYIEILLADCGFSTRVQRNALISRLFGTDIHYLDDLTKSQKSMLINELQSIKSGNKLGKDDRDDRDDRNEED